MDNKEFAVCLKKYRFKRKLTVVQLAEIIEVSDNHMRRLESGKVTPTLDMLMKLTIALGITPNHLLKNDELSDEKELRTISYFKIDSLSEKQVHLLKVIMNAAIDDFVNKVANPVGKRIAKLREARNISSSELGDKIEVTSGYIRNIENGKSKPSVEAIEKICEVFDVDFNYIVCDHSKETELYVLSDMMKNAQTQISPEDYNFLKLLFNSIISDFGENSST